MSLQPSANIGQSAPQPDTIFRRLTLASETIGRCHAIIEQIEGKIEPRPSDVTKEPPLGGGLAALTMDLGRRAELLAQRLEGVLAAL